MFFGMAASPAGGVVTSPETSKRADVQARRGSRNQGPGFGNTEMLPDTTDWYGRSRPKADASNDYLLDRDNSAQRRKLHRSSQRRPGGSGDHGKHGTDLRPLAGAPRHQRHYDYPHAPAADQGGPGPAGQWRDAPGVDHPEFYRQRSGGVILPRSADWLEATQELRRAFVEYPEEFVLETIGERRHT